MTTKQAARQRLQLRRAYVSTSRDMDILAEFERGAKWAGIVIAVAFGLMFALGLVM